MESKNSNKQCYYYAMIFPSKQNKNKEGHVQKQMFKEKLLLFIPSNNWNRSHSQNVKTQFKYTPSYIDVHSKAWLLTPKHDVMNNIWHVHNRLCVVLSVITV